MYPYEVRKVNIVCYATRMKLTQTEGNNVSLVRLWLITITIICSVLGGGSGGDGYILCAHGNNVLDDDGECMRFLSHKKKSQLYLSLTKSMRDCRSNAEITNKLTTHH
jgi:hypothetical protein